MFTKDELANFRTDFNKATKDLEKKYNVKLSLGAIRYTESNFGVKLTANRVGTEEQTERDEYIRLCGFYGLPEDMFGVEIPHNNITLKISGINRRARKNPVNLIGSDGKGYKCGINFVKALITLSKL